VVSAAFLGLSTVYAYGRLVNTDTEIRHKIRQTDVSTYLTPKSRSVGQERIDFQYELYDILQERLIAHSSKIETASPNKKQQIISTILDSEKILESGLELNRLSEEFLSEELGYWKAEVKKYGPEPVADRLESILSSHGPSPVDIRADISDKSFYEGADTQVLSDFQAELDTNTGEVLAEGLAWFRKKASNGSQRQKYPIVITENSRTYDKRDVLNNIIGQKPRRSSSKINFQLPDDVF
jgi:hypothetical protein